MMNINAKAMTKAMTIDSKRSLTPDELEKVIGGGQLSEYLHGQCLAADGIRDAFGMDVAVEWIREYVVQSLECVEWFKAGGGEYMFRMLEIRDDSQQWWKDWC